MNDIIFPFEISPTVRILGGMTLGGTIGGLYGGSTKTYNLLTKEERRKRALTNAAIGAILGGGLAALPDVINF